ncbi:uncharacterized protein A1O5_03793 [Cladophialophora psammophila CBS 110553]|uniref:Uncharacterized protein n=1 Tax=Cladophialophora psammophila CBS 110553 TaxID=1182543 RepID=W9WWQ7_9EURO|nr:uncharacterized protein A1O5_03793 [Cladophialophora psammophila CBS 110553]EXJ72647.1 hypothetical protein A1O5_03793 [Cladophialophora psammophila CBS 110553]
MMSLADFGRVFGKGQELILLPRREFLLPSVSRGTRHDFVKPTCSYLAYLQDTQNRKMCKTEAFKSHTCPHHWMSIVKPCGPEASFKNQTHQYKPARSAWKRMVQPEYISAPADSCPNCDLKGDYDADKTRIILKKPWEAGNLGNGYNMTDGHGRVLPVYHYRGHLPSSTYPSSGPTRVSMAPPDGQWQQAGCCVVM